MKDIVFKIEFNAHKIWWSGPPNLSIGALLHKVVSVLETQNSAQSSIPFIKNYKDIVSSSGGVSDVEIQKIATTYKVLKDDHEILPFCQLNLVQPNDTLKYVFFFLNFIFFVYFLSFFLFLL